MPPPYSVQKFVGKHVSSLKYRAALKLKWMFFLNATLLSVLPQALFQYVQLVLQGCHVSNQKIGFDVLHEWVHQRENGFLLVRYVAKLEITLGRHAFLQLC